MLEFSPFFLALVLYKYTLEELFLISNCPVTKLSESHYREGICWYGCSVARQVVGVGRVAPFVEMPSFKALGELLGESLQVQMIGRVTGQVVAGRCAP
jgi:hypothetical protein